jgi:hypothetical protein
MTDIVLRPMLPSDLPFAAALTLGEGWHSETLEEFEGFFARDPAGCLIAERAGRPLGTRWTGRGGAPARRETVDRPVVRGPDLQLARRPEVLANGTSAKG